MKKIIAIFVLLFTFFNGFSQTENKQNTNEPQISIDNPIANKEYPVDYAFNVRFHIIKNTNGTGVTQNYGETELMDAIKIMNTTFNKYQIFFKYRGFDVIQNTTYMRIRSFAGAYSDQNVNNPLFTALVSHSKTMPNPVYDYNAFNIYIVEGIDMISSGFITRSSGYGIYKGVDSAYSYNQLLSPTLPREIGKNLSLLRTFHKWIGFLNDPQANEPGVEDNNACEIPNPSNEPATNQLNLERGDEVIDTQPCRNYTQSNIAANCTYTPAATPNCNGVAYPLLNTVLRNFMSPNSSCRALGANYLPGTANFTNGQKNRMRAHIAANFNNTANTHGIFNAKTTVASLYQPYKIIHTNGVITHKFQKGFTYTFPNATGSDPATANTNTLPICNNYTVDYPVYIDEIDTSNLAFTYQIVPINTPPNIANPNNDNPYISGVISTTKNMGATNPVQKALNQTEVNDSNLENSLSKDEFHIITKTKQSGESDQKVIYKK